MHTLQAIITGAIQGLSEFLPISSSAHIVFSNELYEIITKTTTSTNHQEEIFFDIMIHLATLLAVIIYFFNDLKNIFKNFFKAIKNKNYKANEVKLVNYIILSTIITGIIGLSIKDIAEKLITNPQNICYLLIITGIILLLSEKLYKGNKKISLKSTILIAIAQGLAVFPGFSRSGFTISTGLICGLDRIEAAKFSFLMSIPIILFASMIYPLMELELTQILSFNLKAIGIGFIVSFITGFLCIKYFMKLLGKLSLKMFGYYCLGMAVLMFVLFQVCHHQ